MLFNYLLVALRNLRKHKVYAAINAAGLAIGMACCILILLYVQDEIRYDRFHANGERIYRVATQWLNPQTGEEFPSAISEYRMAEALAVDFPEMEQIVRLFPTGATTVRHGDKIYNENGFLYVDPNFFEVFTFELLAGDPVTALRDPYTVVITEHIAAKYFGAASPLGQSLTIGDDYYTVTGIVEETPVRSHFEYDILASLTVAQGEFARVVLENWGEMTSFTYMLLPPDLAPVEVEARFPAFLEKNVEAGAADFRRLYLQPLADIYLHSGTSHELGPSGDLVYVYAFSAVAFLVLLVACVNYVNMSTARAAGRAREVGLRKVVGAGQGQLVRQFLGESVTLAVVGFVGAVGLVMAVLPAFNAFVGKALSLNPTADATLLLILAGVVAFVGLVAGVYPALFLARFRPVEALSGVRIGGGASLRKVLVAFQFAVSIFLLIAAVVAYGQLHYARSVDVGYDKSQVVVVQGVPSERGEQFAADLSRSPNVVLAAPTSRVPPGRLSSNVQMRPEGVPDDQLPGMQAVWTGHDFIELLGLEVVAGRSFSRHFPSDATQAFVLNEAAASAVGWTPEEAVGKGWGGSVIEDWSQGWTERDGQVIGVVRDFHFESLHKAIGPVVYYIAPTMAGNFLIRIGPGDMAETLAFIEETWMEYVPGQPFEYRFIDDAFEALYRREERQLTLLGAFAGLAVFIGSIGLVALASFAAQRRTREIGIRRVLGASAGHVVLLLSKEFLHLILLANLLAWPLAYWAMSNWLAGFAYRIDMEPGVFVGAAVAALLAGWLTVGPLALRAALANPVEALQSE
ncbi:MAG: FtsX-like permease family protein [Candidatus Latescibacteria bacterium]|nr:FtsX-like permease family protein [Candidatus Latescibacterota bacterium]